jgi:hypothetical protein
MSADHKTLLAMMDNCRDQINNFPVTGAANKDLQAISKLVKDFTVSPLEAIAHGPSR